VKRESLGRLESNAKEEKKRGRERKGWSIYKALLALERARDGLNVVRRRGQKWSRHRHEPEAYSKRECNSRSFTRYSYSREHH
jgi:hypothetical protein